MSNFGVSQIAKETPAWAKWMFRITLMLTTVASFWLAGTNIIPDEHKVEVINGLKALDVLVFGVSKLFGTEVKQEGICTDESCFPGPQ